MTNILFIPGLACGEGQWRSHAEYFSANNETAIFELPRHPGLSVRGHLDALHAKLDVLRWDRVLIIGHSLGGNLAAAYAHAHPERTEAVVLVDPTGDLRGAVLGEIEDYRKFVRDWFEEILGPAAAETRDRVLSDLDDVGRESFLSTFEAYRDYDFSKVLKDRLDLTLCIDGEGVKGPDSFQRLHPELKRISLPNVGHWLHLDAPEAFRDALKDFSSL